MKKKQYIQPELCVVALRQRTTLLNSSPIILVDPEQGGDVDPGTEVGEGLGREYDFADDEYDSEY